MDGGLGGFKKQSQLPGISKTSSSPNSAFTKTRSSSKIGIGITQATTPSPKLGINKAVQRETVLNIATTPQQKAITPQQNAPTPQQNAPTPQQNAPVPLQEPLTPKQEALKDSMEQVNADKAIAKVNKQAGIGKNNPTPPPQVSAENALAFFTSVAAETFGVMQHLGEVVIEQTPIQIMKLVKQVNVEFEGPMVKTQSNKFRPSKIKRNTRDLRGGTIEGTIEGTTGSVSTTKRTTTYNKMLFATAYIPGILTLFAFLFLLFYLLWTLIVWAFNKILSFLGSNKQTLPSIKFNKKTTQTVYSIFFVITSWYLMLYLVIDYYRKLGSELDIVQIFKQLIGASYILWPMLVLIIGSGIAKAFYKISCSGNKPNVLSWAKIVESSALYVLGICVLITVILLFKPINWIYKKVFPNILKDKFTNITNLLAVTLKLMVIYILLRMITVMIEDVISNKIVFFISKFNKDVEAPPVDCNVEEKKTAKQSEIARILEEIYMYISGIIVCIIAIFILVIQCPHPYMTKTSKINHAIGSFILKVTGIATKFIVENKDRQVDCNEKKKGSGFFSIPTSGRGAIVSQNYQYSLADMKDADIQTADRRLGQAAEDARALAKASQEKAPAQSAEYVVSNDDNRHSTAPEPKVDQNSRI